MLSPGARVGPYEVTGPLGAGGMGEVYRARDTKLDRDVALKVLPEAFTSDADRLARFQREAKVLASLNHPHIAQIHGLEEADGQKALVLELVEGPTLADRIARGPIPLDEALPIAKQIAEALEAAHEQGVIHRDLKPANVKVRPDGTVKVLDFGLAKAYEAEWNDADNSQSPTLSARATQAGVILGTAAYMAPEQARGKPVDKRADIWAFGAVLYEMLTGRQAFIGEDLSLTLAEVMKSEPDWTKLTAGSPLLRRLLQRCLEKDRRRRLQAIGDARIEIEDMLDDPGSAPGIEKGPSTARPLPMRVLVWVGVLLAGSILGALASRTLEAPETPVRLPARLDIILPEEAPLAPTSSVPLALGRPLLAISPDGRLLSWVAHVDGSRQLYVRDMTSGEVTPLPDTDDALSPFFSPDGEWIGFFANGQLKKVSVRGGSPTSLAEAQIPWGGSWASEGHIYFTRTVQGISRVASTGGLVEDVTVAGARVVDALPHVLPGGRAMVFNGASGGIWVHTFGESPPREILEQGSQARYVEPGYLLYADRGKMWSVPFDVVGLTVTGPPVIVLDDLKTEIDPGLAAQFAVTRSGTVVYAAGLDGAEGSAVWVDQDGSVEPLGLPRARHQRVDLSDDGSVLAVPIDEGVNVDIYLWSVLDRRLKRFTTGGRNVSPLFTPDGQSLIFSSWHAESASLMLQPLDGSEEALPLLQGGTYSAGSISPDGMQLAVQDISTSFDVVILSLEGTPGDMPAQTTQPFAQTDANEVFPAFSPAGGWIAFVSDVSGRFEVYMRPYPEPGSTHQVTTDGGEQPVWNPDGSQLFYRNATTWYSVDVAYEPELTLGTPQRLFSGPFLNLRSWSYDVAPDGRFVAVHDPEMDRAPTELKVITDVVGLIEPGR